MANIFINGFNAKTGGGKSILNNYLSLLFKRNNKHNYFVLTPSKYDYDKYATQHIKILKTKKWFQNTLFFPYLYSYGIPKMLKKQKIDILFNLSDIPIRTTIKQVFLYDWAYAVYPHSIVWKQMDLRSWVFKKAKLWFFIKFIRFIDLMIAQTNTIQNRLHQIYSFENIEVIPNAVSLENMTGGKNENFGLCQDKIKFLYLSYYYPHKNIEIFLPLAKLIKKNKLPYCLVITISTEQHKKAKKFLSTVQQEELENIIINIGPVSMDEVPSLYQQCDALLMPTLLESFSGTYVEAMYHQKPILTSDYDFAKDVCGDSAFYFDPLDEFSILDQMRKCFDDEGGGGIKIVKGKQRLSELRTWEQTFDEYQSILEDILNLSSTASS